MKRRDYSCNTSFLDLLFNMLLAFTCLFVLAFALVNVRQKDADSARPRAEFVITLAWPDDLDDDLDLWVEDPNGALVFFQRREDGLMHLDRDDLGARNDIVQTVDGPVQFEGNQEVVMIRGIIQGEYVVNVHAYLKHSQPPVVATVRIDKIGQGVVSLKKVELNRSGDEATATRITVGPDGRVTGSSDLPKNLVRGIRP
jgi:hypothetical protein